LTNSIERDSVEETADQTAGGSTADQTAGGRDADVAAFSISGRRLFR
jgi:hypothetical protein